MTKIVNINPHMLPDFESVYTRWSFGKILWQKFLKKMCWLMKKKDAHKKFPVFQRSNKV